MNAMRGGAKTGWIAGLCPEPHGIPIFGSFVGRLVASMGQRRLAISVATPVKER